MSVKMVEYDFFITLLDCRCVYDTIDDKRKVYEWLVENFGGRMPYLGYSHWLQKNERWAVQDNFRLYDGKGEFSVFFYDKLDYVAFKLRWL